MMTGRKIKTKINPLIELLELLNPLIELLELLNPLLGAK